MPAQTPLVCEETFAPILYVMEYETPGRGDRPAQRRAPGFVQRHIHARPGAVGGFSGSCRFRLRHRQRQHRHQRRGDRRRVWRREKRPEGAANRAPTPGKLTCGGKRTRSITQARCHWRRVWSLIFEPDKRRAIGQTRTVALTGRAAGPMPERSSEIASPDQKKQRECIRHLARPLVIAFDRGQPRRLVIWRQAHQGKFLRPHPPANSGQPPAPSSSRRRRVHTVLSCA